MAMDIFTGNNTKVEISETTGDTVATDFLEVNNVASFTVSGSESNVITVKTFNDNYDRKLIGKKSVPDISLSVVYVPDDAQVATLETAHENQTKLQVRLSYFQDATRTTGFYVVYNVYVAKATLAGDMDKEVTKEFSLSVTGGPVSSGMITGA